MIIPIDEDTVKEVTEKIIDLKALKQRIADIDLEIGELQKQPDEILKENTEKKTISISWQRKKKK